jgi:Abortive infection C-terminus
VERLTELLLQLMAWRSHSGDAHGKGPGATAPPRELADLAIHWAGAFIVYLAESQSSKVMPGNE